jgi:hypothetical protein
MRASSVVFSSRNSIRVWRAAVFSGNPTGRILKQFDHLALINTGRLPFHQDVFMVQVPSPVILDVVWSVLADLSTIDRYTLFTRHSSVTVKVFPKELHRNKSSSCLCSMALQCDIQSTTD